jgi:hypothetical protein
MYPKVLDAQLVGEYSALASSGGGYVWDEVLEYRVWCHPEDGDDYYYAFDDVETAFKCSSEEDGAEMPLALVLQREYISENEPGEYVHVKEERITEWPLEFLQRPRRAENTISDFLSPNAPDNKLEILRGMV